MKPSEYKWIQRWGNFLHSFQYYIDGEQDKAAADNAPAGAIYAHTDSEGKRTGWATITDITDPVTQYYFTSKFNDCPKEWSKWKANEHD